MRIKNIGKAKIIFNGGFIAPSKVVNFEDEKLGAVLLRAYPDRLENIDALEPVATIKAEVKAEDDKTAETDEKTSVRGKKGGKKR